jgi:hypothetical protein
VLATALFGASVAAGAQTVIQSDLTQLQPQVSRDEEGFSACGVRAVVAVLRRPPNVDYYDFSLNFYHKTPGGGLAKIGKQAVNLDTKKVVRAIPGPISFWLAAEQTGKPVIVQKLQDSPETQGFKIGVVELEPGFAVLMQILQGERMHFAARYKNEPLETVIAFSGKLEKNEEDALKACIGGLIKRWEQLLK